MKNWLSVTARKGIVGINLFIVLSLQTLPVLALEASSSASTTATEETPLTSSSAPLTAPSISVDTSGTEDNETEDPNDSSTSPSQTSTSSSEDVSQPSTSQTTASTSSTLPSSTTSSTAKQEHSPSQPSTSNTIHSSTAGQFPIYRLYHAESKSYFYTKNTSEYESMPAHGWRPEGVAWYSSNKQGQAVYRLYHPTRFVHIFTRHESEVTRLTERGWKSEGIAFFSHGSKAIYRLYHPQQNKYFYTHSLYEYTKLSLLGWKQEGIAFAAVPLNPHATPELPPLRGTITIEQHPEETPGFDIIISDLAAPLTIQAVKLPVWSNKNGQDDLIWYTAILQADGTYRARVNYRNHQNNLGLYHIHLYYTLNYRDIGIAASQTDLRVLPISSDFTFTSQVTKQNQLTLNLQGVDPRMSSIKVAIWSDKNDQDDLTWHDFKKVGDGLYQTTIALKHHNFETGLYHVHFYGKTQSRREIVRHEKLTIDQLASPLQAPSISTVNLEPTKGQLSVRVQEFPLTKPIQSVRIAMWSQKNQENLYWYIHQPTAATSTVPLHIGFHRYLSGTYFIHAYIHYKDGSTHVKNLGQITLTSPYKGSLQAVLKAASSMVGVRGGTPLHAQLVADYNSVTPLPVGYAVKHDDDWCDVFITVIYQRLNLTHLVGRECGVDRHIQIFKSLGIWHEDGTMTPRPGDIITFNLDSHNQPNDGFADHIGIVERVENGRIYTIEGNYLNEVRRSSYPIGEGTIRGFARPRY